MERLILKYEDFKGFKIIEHELAGERNKSLRVEIECSENPNALYTVLIGREKKEKYVGYSLQKAIEVYNDF